MSFAYIHQYYGVEVWPGRRVTVYGREGIVVKAIGQYIGVNFDNTKPGVVLPCHPTDGVEYGGYGKIRAMTRAQQRYADFLEVGDVFGTFAEYLRYLTWKRNHPEAA